ncbi:MAG: hypothetical protein RR250_00655 [Akkermansia sp.]
MINSSPCKLIILSLGVSLGLTSCFGLITDALGPKPEYIGEKPAAVIPDTQAQKMVLLQRDAYELPASSELMDQQIKYGANNIPYGIISPYRDCIHSPYSPFRRLSTTGLKSGALVHDPFDGKAFYLP